ncbi:MAG: hypothetical protein JOZ18_19020 [Chloroflexi bacterium]|nr:hypothetical protein [Chloroflexota bacterium]
MSSLPFTEQQCFFVVMLAFIVIGFQRGWRRELVTLVFVLLGVFLVRQDTGRTFAQFLARLPGTITFFMTGTPQPGVAGPATSPLGPWGSLLLFAIVMGVGYFVGNKAFPAKPATPQERFIGIVPAVISGAFVLAYLDSFLPKDASGRSALVVNVQSPDPGNYVPVIFVIAVVAVVIALIAARAKKSPAKK